MLVLGTAIATGIITLIVAITKLIISKEDRISEFRKEYMGEIRGNVSALLGCATTICRLAEYEKKGPSKGISDINEFRAKHKEFYNELNKAWHGALVRLKPEDTDTGHLIASINVLSSEFYGDCSNLNSIEKKIEDVQKHTREVTYNIWKKVKRGETIFHIFKWLCIILAIFSLLSLLLFVKPIINYTKSLELDKILKEQLLDKKSPND